MAIQKVFGFFSQGKKMEEKKGVEIDSYKIKYIDAAMLILDYISIFFSHLLPGLQLTACTVSVLVTID